MRVFLKHFALITLRVFFRKIVVIGEEKVPRSGPLLFVLNHNNALVDPAFVLCLAPRKVSFLAKAPLFKMPVIGWMLRVMESLPVYRRQDEGSNTAQNREMFDAAKAILANGGTIALFPEGISHSESKLKPLKTGAARIAIGASPLKIVPAGLYYTAKKSFRSSAALVFTDPFDVPKTECGPDGEPTADAVRDLTARIEQALKTVTLQADHNESLILVSRAERIFRSAEASSSSEKHDPLSELELKKLFIAGYSALRERFPEKLEEIKSLIDQYEASLDEAGIDPFHLRPHRLDPVGFLMGLFKALGYVFLAGLFFPFVVTGLLLHFPAYRIAGMISVRYAKEEEDMISTVKMLAAMLFFPLTWLLAAIFAGRHFGAWGFLISLFVLPFSGFCALIFLEKLNSILGRAKTFGLFFSNPKSFQMLLEDRERIRKTILALGQLKI